MAASSESSSKCLNPCSGEGFCFKQEHTLNEALTNINAAVQRLHADIQRLHADINTDINAYINAYINADIQKGQLLQSIRNEINDIKAENNRNTQQVYDAFNKHLNENVVNSNNLNKFLDNKWKYYEDMIVSIQNELVNLKNTQQQTENNVKRIDNATNIFNDSITKSIVSEQADYAKYQLAVIDKVITTRMVKIDRRPEKGKRALIRDFKSVVMDEAIQNGLKINDRKVLGLLRIYFENPEWIWGHSNDEYYVEGYEWK